MNHQFAPKAGDIYQVKNWGQVVVTAVKTIPGWVVVLTEEKAFIAIGSQHLLLF